MKTSEKGKSLIKKFEGCRLQAYRCSAGVWTIGYGHTGKDVHEEMRITQQEAEELLQKDLEEREKQVAHYLKTDLNQNQYDAVISFVYNVGIGNFIRSTLFRLINENPHDEKISAEFMKWSRSGPGLIIRRTKEAELYFS